MKTLVLILIGFGLAALPALTQTAGRLNQPSDFAGIASGNGSYESSPAKGLTARYDVAGDYQYVETTRMMHFKSMRFVTCSEIKATGLFEKPGRELSLNETFAEFGIGCSCILDDYIIVSDFSSYETSSLSVVSTMVMTIHISEYRKNRMKENQIPPLMLKSNKFASVKRAMNLPRTALIYISPNAYKTRYNIMAPGLKIRMNL